MCVYVVATMGPRVRKLKREKMCILKLVGVRSAHLFGVFLQRPGVLMRPPRRKKLHSRSSKWSNSTPGKITIQYYRLPARTCAQCYGVG